MQSPTPETSLDHVADTFRLFASQVPCPVAILNQEFRFVFVNQRWLSDFGLESDQVLGRVYDQVFQKTDGRWKILRTRCFAGRIEKSDKEMLLTVDGHLIVFSWEMHPLKNETGGVEGVLWFCEKLTEQKRMEQALRQNEERLALALKASQLGVWDLDLQTNEIVWSSEVHRVIGVYPDELTLDGFTKLIHPDDLDRALSVTKQAIEEKKDYSLEFRVRLPDGSVRWLLNLGHGLYDPQGRPLRIIGTVQNISERKNAEAGLLQMQHLESIGRLASGVAHDINNVLAPVVAGASLLRESNANPQDFEILDLIQRSAERGAEIIRQLLAFGRGIDGERIPLSFSTVISEVRTIIKDTFPKNIRLRCQFDTTVDAVLGDRNQLHQVLINLCVNAREAMPEGGLLEIRLSAFEADEAFCNITPDARLGSYVVLSVSDNGLGVAPEHLEQIFEPFFTTKGMGSRSGLGLSSVLGITRTHNGFIQLKSRQGEGTCVKVFLPLHRGGAIPVPVPADVAPAHRGHGETILVVDDESGVREIIQDILTRAGYRVLQANDGLEGLARYREETNSIKALVTDLLMPCMDGFKLVSEVHRTDPTLPVLAISGTLQLASSRELGELGPVYFLPKPFTSGVLLQAIAAAVARSNAGNKG